MDTLSLLEKLPRELVRKIIEFVPESVFNLLLTSRTLQSSVEEYAREQTTIPIVDELVVFGARGCKPPNFLMIEMSIPTCKSPLFELRMKLRHAPPIKFFQRFENYFSKKVFYTVKMTENDDHKEIVHFLGECAGGRVGKVAINCEDEKFVVASKLLDGLKFSRLFVNTRPLTDGNVSRMLDIILSHAIDEFTLYAGNSFVTDPVEFLLRVSTYVRSLTIRQQGTIEIERNRSTPFLIPNINWTSIITRMFSAKLDTLRIDNLHNPGFINRQGAHELRKKLPQLGKAILFKSSCEKFRHELQYTENDHVVKAARIHAMRVGVAAIFIAASMEILIGLERVASASNPKKYHDEASMAKQKILPLLAITLGAATLISCLIFELAHSTLSSFNWGILEAFFMTSTLISGVLLNIRLVQKHPRLRRNADKLLAILWRSEGAANRISVIIPSRNEEKELYFEDLKKTWDNNHRLL